MPPPKSNRRLSAEQKKLLERWIAEGAHLRPALGLRRARRGRPSPPCRRGDWVRKPIDRFVLAKLEAEGLAPSPEADRPTLIKRLSIDLAGLAAHARGSRCLRRRRRSRGLREARRSLARQPALRRADGPAWLDAARYADSNGFQQDGDTWQWIWRDWVVKALNDDLPFDQFTIWQLAGDLLPEATDRSERSPAASIATIC